MSDADLDDFFAKKDKSKKKAKATKFTAGDILAKQVENSEKPKKVTKKKKESSAVKEKSTQQSTKNIREDDEWHDYVEEAAKDFSDLKIQNIQVTNKEDADDGDRPGEGAGSDDEDGEGSERRETASGPWNKSAAANKSTAKTEKPVAKPEPKPEPPKPEPPKTTGKYIPPGMRRAMESGGLEPVNMSQTRQPRGRKKAAPDVMSEEDFPTLGGADTQESNLGVPVQVPAKFETVRGGGRQGDDPRNLSQKVEIGNKFDALAGSDS